MPPTRVWFDDGFQARRLRALPHVPGPRLRRPGGAAGLVACCLGSPVGLANRVEACPVFRQSGLHPGGLATTMPGPARDPQAKELPGHVLPPCKAKGVPPAAGCRREGKTGGGGQHSSACRRTRSLWPCNALDGQGDHHASPRDALRRRQFASPNSSRVTPIATGVAAAPDPRAHRQPHDIQQTSAGHSQSFRPEGGGSQETDELGACPARRSRDQRQVLALPAKIVGQPNRVTACFIPADAPSPGNCDNRGQSQIEVTCQRANGLGKMRRTRHQDERYHHLSRIPANRTAMCRPGGGSGSEVVIRPSARASVGKRDVEWLVPCAFQNPRLDDGLGPKSIQPPGGLVHQHVSAGARNSLRQQNAARPEGLGDQWPGPQSHPVKPAPSSGESRLEGIPGMGRHARRGSKPLHVQRWHPPFPNNKPSSPPFVEATAQLHYPSPSWGCSAAESWCRA